jgi:ketosteroid isomerase-like protein
MASATQNLEQTKLAMAETNRLFETQVVKNRNVDALDDIYTSDARILPPGAPMISGRLDIKRFWSEMIHSTQAKSCTLISVDVMPAGEGVVEIGKATLSVGAPDGDTQQLDVKYVVFWRHQEGRWRWHVDIWNQNS